LRPLKHALVTLVAGLFALSLAAAVPAQADRVNIGFFFNKLQPYGTWVRNDEFNYVFVPEVRSGWRPYVHGRWVLTNDYGWYWVSDEPFAWATYHYGRWGYSADMGWFWVPGTVWAPAWVSWRTGGDYVGWAPLAPHGRGYVIGYVDYYEPPILEAWVFVPERHFVATNIGSYVIPVADVNVIFAETNKSYHVDRHDGRVVNAFLPRREVTKIVGKEIETYKVKNASGPSETSVEKDSINAFRPEIGDAKPKEAPKEAVKGPDELKNKPVLTETAKGNTPKGAPPSAAELKPSRAGEAKEAEGQKTPPETEQAQPGQAPAQKPEKSAGGPGKGQGAEKAEKKAPEAAEKKAATPKAGEENKQPAKAAKEAGQKSQAEKARAPQEPKGAAAQPSKANAPGKKDEAESQAQGEAKKQKQAVPAGVAEKPSARGAQRGGRLEPPAPKVTPVRPVLLAGASRRVLIQALAARQMGGLRKITDSGEHSVNL